MKTHAFLGLSALLGAGLVATQAHATTWDVEDIVTAVALKDNANTGGSGKQIRVIFDQPVSYCGTTSESVYINVADSTLWEQWYETARAALLSGRPLRIAGSDATGTCKTYYVELND